MSYRGRVRMALLLSLGLHHLAALLLFRSVMRHAEVLKKASVRIPFAKRLKTAVRLLSVHRRAERR